MWDSLEVLWRTVHRKAKDAYWYVRGVLWDRHNVLKIKTLPPTWTDRDTHLVHAIFQILTDFLEEECSPGHVDWDATEHHKAAMAEMQDHYTWWHSYGKDYDAFDHVPQPEGVEWSLNMTGPVADQWREWSMKVSKLEEEFEAELERRMIRIVQLRGYYWT